MNTTTPPLTTTPVRDQVPVTAWEPRTYPGTLAPDQAPRRPRPYVFAD